jgi:O-methyltransferase
MNREQFIDLATNIKNDTIENRSYLCDTFDIVHSNVECMHDPSEAYYMAHHILYNQNIPGSIVEFGCYKGGMSCKLSYVAKLVGKEVVLFDSFIGLLESGSYVPQSQSDNSITYDFEQGMFASTIQETTSNLINYGEHTVCSFMPGTIEKLLPIFDRHPSFVLIDVDIIGTCMTIIEKLWDKITTELIFFHESCIVDMMNALSDNDFWQTNFGTNTPAFGHSFYNKEYSLPNTNCLNFIAKPNVQLSEIF